MPPPARIPIHTFKCHTDDCCPVLSHVPTAEPAKQFVITDDHGGAIQLSREQVEEIMMTDISTLGI